MASRIKDFSVISIELLISGSVNHKTQLHLVPKVQMHGARLSTGKHCASILHVDSLKCHAFKAVTLQHITKFVII